MNDHTAVTPDEQIRAACETGARDLYGPTPSAHVTRRLEHELDLIRSQQLAPDFLSIAELTSDIRTMGVLVGPGRGSSASALVCYLLGITTIDPLEHGLLFERLLPAPGAHIDIDLCVPSRRLGEIAERLGAPFDPAGGHGLAIERNDLAVDVVGLRALDRIEVTLERIAEYGGPSINPWRIAADDPDTYALLGTAPNVEAVGLLDSLSARRAVYEVQPHSINELASIVALNRPGSLENLETYVSHTESPDRGAQTPRLAELLADTRGLLVYQEQVALAAMSVGGLDGLTANLLRRAAGRRDRSVLDDLHPLFLAGAHTAGLDESEAERAWGALVTAGGPAFCKSHALSVALMGYCESHLEMHFPKERAAAREYLSSLPEPLRWLPLAPEDTSVALNLGSPEFDKLVQPPRAGEVVLLASESPRVLLEAATTAARDAAQAGTEVACVPLSHFNFSFERATDGSDSIRILRTPRAIVEMEGAELFESPRPRLLVLDRLDLDESVLGNPSAPAVQAVAKQLTMLAQMHRCVVMVTLRTDGPPEKLGRFSGLEWACDVVVTVEDDKAAEGERGRMTVVKANRGRGSLATPSDFGDRV